MPEAIRIENLVKTYRRGKVRALDGVSLSVRKGEVLGVIGPNGAGKTTLMGCLLGFLDPDSGLIAIEGRQTSDIRVRAATGYLSERLSFDRWMKGLAYMQYQHGLTGRPESGREGEIRQALESVGLEEPAWNRPIRKYSRGMLQRLGLAQAFLGRPSYLFLDEPTSGMDPSGVLLFRGMVTAARKQGSTILINSHQLEQVSRLCDRVVFVKGGKAGDTEALRAARGGDRVIKLRWIAGTVVSPSKIQGLAGKGIQYLRTRGTSATFSLTSEDRASALVKAAVKAGIPVVEAAFDTQDLEELFSESPR